MGKNISVYLPDEQINFISSQKGGPSKIVQKAIRLVMKTGKNESGYDDVLAAAKEIRKGHDVNNVIQLWHHERDADRW
jgi:ribosomal protein S7